MAEICFYFQVHQPFRLRRYSVFDSDPFYFDNQANEAILKKVADKCYRPTTRMLLELVERHQGRFKCAFSITGTVLDQLAQWAPDVLDLFRELSKHDCVEFLGETTHHSLAFLFSRDEFDAQVSAHAARMQSLFGRSPTTFRNTELIYLNELAGHMAWRGNHSAILCEGVDRLLAGRSPNFVWSPPPRAIPAGARAIKLLLKNHRLSDDIAFRFGNRSWSDWPLDADKFARWVDQINGNGFLCNLFMDYETFGEHQWSETGIFEFLRALPDAVFRNNPGKNGFILPREAAARYEPMGEYDIEKPISWADSERDLSAWLGNPLQDNAVQELYALEAPVKERAAAGDQFVLEDWRKLTTSDHIYYMCTKHWADGDVHKYFSPYDSPYDAYINFMNVLDNLRQRAGV
ncbi:MAG: glycoside hydrolase family 57 protein [Planctomycetota bacterium]|nr:glycoside hydrolase family 57 protein [Planctomycetota bacterium]